MSKRQIDDSPRKLALLEAAKDVFSRYGYRRTSMADIAETAGVSRPALYEHFRSKEDVFRSTARAMCDHGIAAAEAAWPPDVRFGDGLAAAILAKDLPFFRLIRLSPHGAEILAQHQTLTLEMHDELRLAFAALVAERAGGGAEAQVLGIAVADAVDGLKHGAKDEAEFLAGVARLSAVLGAGIEATRARAP